MSKINLSSLLKTFPSFLLSTLPKAGKNGVEGTVMTDKDIACIKVEGSGNATGKVVGASVGVKAAPAFSNIPIVGWLAAGFVTMFAQDKGSEIGGQIARDYNDC